MSQITTITFFKFDTFKQKIWGFKMMNAAHQYLAKAKGQTFYKLMGSGRGNGFNPFPDWSVYSLLQVWENETAANDFFNHSELNELYQNNTKEVWTLYLKNIMAKGEWSGGNPFEVSSDLDKKNLYLGIITRARIKTSKLIKFWRYVPTSQKRIDKMKGLLYTKGIGEVPIVQMATFSIWKDFESLKAFAYDSEEHKKAIQLTRELDWYKEELFARFQPYKSLGTWQGKVPLAFGNESFVELEDF